MAYDTMKARYLSLHPLLLWQHMERPIDWPRHFGRVAPLEVEVGFGNGEFLLREAQQHPDWNLVGIELAWASVQRGLRKIAQTRTSNVRLLLVEAQGALERLFLPQSIQRLYALFPCPWPKERHTKHRLFGRGFLTLLNSRLAPHGEVQIVTDYQPYLHWVLTQLPGTGFTAHWTPVPPRFSTKYERKWRAEGQQEFYDLRLHKTQHHALPVKEDVTLQIHQVPSFDPTRVPSGILLQGAITVACKEWLYDPTRKKGLLCVFVVEDGFRQDFWLEIAHADDHWVIRPAYGCGIIPTVGVQRALDAVRDLTQRSTA
jgi:tRNA (guanine-N7-)-methyltransferase